ncbi:hypothetical protein AAX29_01654 [Aliarcobacter thereius]|uniref:Uncharacterized protein n=1 Tax=Aliarcobacter thereius TaxID=544718 RepID=A0A1C0B5U0_9BACT|nr:hypothetical protein [Aliarcobacter thereius]OCL98415.1 hypothetical protein AAX29_01654 [Aliarcobacter thereius]
MIKNITIFMFLTTLLYSNSFDDIQRKGKEVKKIVEAEERFINAFENNILQNFKIVDGNYINSSGLIPADINISGLNNKELYFNSNLNKDFKDDSFLNELYKSNTFRQRSYFNDDKIYFNIENSLAKLLYTLMIYKKIDEIKVCPSSFSSKIDICTFENSIYVDIKKYGNLFEDSSSEKKPSEFLLAFNINSYEKGPIIVDKIDEDEPILNFFSNGTHFFDKDGIKFVKVGDEGAKDKKFVNLTNEE